MGGAWAVLRTTFRDLSRRPGFSLVVLLSLGLAIGANTAIFSVVDAVLIRPLPYENPERIVSVWHTAPAIDVPKFQQADGTYLVYRELNTVFDDIGAYRTDSVNLAGEQSPVEVDAALVTPSIFFVLGAKPVLGRTFTEEEERPGGGATAILSHELWSSAYASDPGIVGRDVLVEGSPRTVVGVMPAGFRFPAPETRIWLPLEIDPTKADTGNFLYASIARLREGVSPDSAAAEISALVKRLPEEAANPHMSAEMIENIGMAALVVPLKEDLVGDISGVLQLLLVSAGVVLLIACANVANLFLAHAEGRYREMAMRAALGATRWQIARAILLESTVLTVGAGALGVALAAGAIRVLGRIQGHDIPRLEEVSIGAGELGFTLALSLLAGLLVGALPALRAIASLGTALREYGGQTAGRTRHRARRVLVVAQIALALVLVISAGLMLKSLRTLLLVDPGFESAGVTTMHLALPFARYDENAEYHRFSSRLLESVRALPGVRSAAAVDRLALLEEPYSNTHVIEEFPPEEGQLPPFHPNRMVSPGYFETMGIPLLEGRAIRQSDLDAPVGSVVVSEALAKHYWPAESAIGKRLRPETTRPGVWHTIVGVVGSTRDHMNEDPTQAVYYPLISRATPEGREIHALDGLSLLVRSDLPPGSLVEALREAVRQADPGVSVARVRSLDEVARLANAQPAFLTLLFACAAVLAVALGAVGLYSAISYTVGQRTREMGVRMAMGADGLSVVWLVLRQALGLALVGIALGIAGALALGRELEALLFGVGPTDPATFTAVGLLILLVTLLASYIPARRAAHIDPMAALRHE